MPLDSRLRMLLMACGVLAWAGVILPVLVQPESRVEAPSLWWIGVVAHQACYLVQHFTTGEVRYPKLIWASGIGMVLSGVCATAVWLAEGLTPLLLVINVASLGFVLARAWAIAMLLANAAFITVALPMQGLGWDWTISYYALMFFATIMVSIAVRESAASQLSLEATTKLAAANERLRAANRELAQAQAQLARQRVDEERLRIARDLHDTIGHQLTALTLNLEVAAHIVEGRATPHVEQSRELAKGILGDIRQVVSRMRDPGVGIEPEVRRLADNVSAGIDVQVHVDERLDVLPPAAAEAVVRVVQEGLTNTARHSGASHAWVRVALESSGPTPSAGEPGAERVAVEVRDDGRGAGAIAPGNGLLGMTERLRAIGGTLRWAAPAAGGFHLMAHIPLGENLL